MTGKKSVRASLDEQFALAEKKRKKQLQDRRLSIAKEGMKFYEAHRHADAVQAFLQYLKILEELKKVPERGLHPGLFDKKLDLPEVIVLTSIYWDLVKLYDRTKSQSKYRDFKHYLDQYILFSKSVNQAFQGTSEESLRKYISNGKTVHTKDFKKAYVNLTGGRCYIATALIDVSSPDNLPTLRQYRDRVLSKSSSGRIVIWVYYFIGPFLAKITNILPTLIRSWLGIVLNLTTKAISAKFQSVQDEN